MGREIDDLVEQSVEVGFLQGGFGHPGVAQQVLHDVFAPLAFALDLLNVFEARIVRIHLAFQVGGIAQDDSQRVVDFVSHPRGQDAERGHLVLLGEGTLQFLVPAQRHRHFVEVGGQFAQFVVGGDGESGVQPAPLDFAHARDQALNWIG